MGIYLRQSSTRMWQVHDGGDDDYKDPEDCTKQQTLRNVGNDGHLLLALSGSRLGLLAG
jgi:hypothetical protein